MTFYLIFKDNINIVTPLLLHFCCPYLDELHRLLTRFSTGVKRAVHEIKDVSHLFSFELVREEMNNFKPDNKEIQMKLMAQFLFLHPTYKRLIEFVSETVFLTFTRLFRHNELKKFLNQMVNEYFQANPAEKENDSSQTEICLTTTSLKFSKSCSCECLEQGKK